MEFRSQLFVEIIMFAFMKNANYAWKERKNWSLKSNLFWEIEFNGRTTWTNRGLPNWLPMHISSRAQQKFWHKTYFGSLISISGRCYISTDPSRSFIVFHLVSIFFCLRFDSPYFFNNETKYKRFNVWRVHSAVTK